MLLTQQGHLAMACGFFPLPGCLIKAGLGIVSSQQSGKIQADGILGIAGQLMGVGDKRCKARRGAAVFGTRDQQNIDNTRSPSCEAPPPACGHEIP